jgi:hypothetical protein
MNFVQLVLDSRGYLVVAVFSTTEFCLLCQMLRHSACSFKTFTSDGIRMDLREIDWGGVGWIQ